MSSSKTKSLKLAAIMHIVRKLQDCIVNVFTKTVLEEES